MKSSRNYKPAPCICGKVCPCHNPKPYDSNDDYWFAVCMFLLAFGIVSIFVGIVQYKESKALKQPKHIEVNGQDCIVGYHQDGATSTGASWGHEVAICPK